VHNATAAELHSDGLSPAVASALDLLTTVERSRFDPSTPIPDASHIARAIEDLTGA